MESNTPMQELLQSAFAKSYYADNGTGIDPQVIDLIDLEEIVQSMLPAESTLIAEHRMMKEALEEIQKAQGEYSMDRLEHAGNTIKSMINTATETLKQVTL
jgi:hypothetical protein